jgi:hypothetical protein
MSGNVNIIRTVAGLALPIRCYFFNGDYFGSCNYNDLCRAWEHFLFLMETPFINRSLVKNSICPFDTPAILKVTTYSYDLPNMSTSVLSFISSGDFDITLRASDSAGFFGCIKVKLTMRPAPITG